MIELEYILELQGKMIFAPDEAKIMFSSCSEEAQTEILQYAELLHLEMLFYFFFRDELPLQWRNRLRETFQAISAWELNYSAGRDLIFRQLRSVGIQPAAIKGAYLAYDVYPHPVLRAKGDYDIWIPEAGAEAAVAALEKVGFSVIAGIAPGHHLPMMVHRERRWSVELHLQVFHAYPRQPSPSALTEFLQEDGSFEPELHWLIALEHGRRGYYAGLMRALLDMGILQHKFSLSAERIQEIRRKLSLPTHPALLHEAFPDFFPKEQRMFHRDYPDWVLQQLRSLLGSSLYQGVMRDYQLSRPGTIRKIGFLAGRTLSLTPSFIRRKYGLKSDCGIKTLMRHYWREISEKIHRLRTPVKLDEETINAFEAGQRLDHFLDRQND